MFPRRAVVVHGEIREKKDVPNSVEIESVSKMCENELRNSGKKTYPRFTTCLVDVALATNEQEAWRVVCDDIRTADLDCKAIDDMFVADRSLPAKFATCMVTAKTPLHFLHMLTVYKEITPFLGGEIKSIIGVTLAYSYKSLFDMLAAVMTVKRDMRDFVLSEISKYVVSNLSNDANTELVRIIIATKKYELLRAFMDVHINLTNEDITKLLKCVVTSSFTSKPYVVSFVAKMLDDVPTMLDDFRNELVKLIHRTVLAAVTNEYVDKRLVLSLGIIMEKVYSSFDASETHGNGVAKTSAETPENNVNLSLSRIGTIMTWCAMKII